MYNWSACCATGLNIVMMISYHYLPFTSAQIVVMKYSWSCLLPSYTTGHLIKQQAIQLCIRVEHNIIITRPSFSRLLYSKTRDEQTMHQYNYSYMHLVCGSNFGSDDFSCVAAGWAFIRVPFVTCESRLLHSLPYKSVATTTVERFATKDCRSKIRGKVICRSEVVLCLWLTLCIDGDKWLTVLTTLRKFVDESDLGSGILRIEDTCIIESCFFFENRWHRQRV